MNHRQKARKLENDERAKRLEPAILKALKESTMSTRQLMHNFDVPERCITEVANKHSISMRSRSARVTHIKAAEKRARRERQLIEKASAEMKIMKNVRDMTMQQLATYFHTNVYVISDALKEAGITLNKGKRAMKTGVNIDQGMAGELSKTWLSKEFVKNPIKSWNYWGCGA